MSYKICCLKIDVLCKASVNFHHVQIAHGHVPSAAPAAKNASHLPKTSQKYCACHTKRLSTLYQVRENATKCHMCHKRHCTTLQTSKSRLQPGQLQMVADGCGRQSSLEQTRLHPQTCKVKREPLPAHSGIRYPSTHHTPSRISLLWAPHGTL